MATYTTNLNLKLIQPTDLFADDSFNAVIEDADNKLVGIAHLTSGAHFEIWEANTTYEKYDMIRTPYLKSNQYLECTTAGTTGTSEPTYNIVGTSFTDGTSEWIVKTFNDATSFDMISPWRSGTTYARGALVRYNTKLYRCITPHTASTFYSDNTYWQIFTASITTWASTMFYAVNDTVINDNKIYKCITANNDSTFTDSNWTLIGGVTFLKTWTADTTYEADELVSYSGKIYKSLSKHSSSSFLPANFELVTTELPIWVSGNEYFVDDVVVYDNTLYICTTANTDSSFTYSNWVPLNKTGYINDWVSGTHYYVNTVVLNNGRMYRCVTDNTDSTFTESNWELINFDIETWTSGTNYQVGQFVTYNNVIYSCKTANSDTTFNPTNWTKIAGSGLSNWESNYPYAVNDIVIANDRIYQCTTAHTSGTDFDATNWKEISSYVVNINDWATNTGYAIGDLVTVNQQIYRCIVAHTSTTFSDDSANWEMLSPTLDQITDWDTNIAYESGDLVIYNTKLYRAVNTHTSSDFDTDFSAGNWEEISAGINTFLWESNKAYNEDEIVVYENRLYICIGQHTSSNDFSSDIANWDLVTNTQDWDSGIYYPVGAICINNGILYKCIVAHTSTSDFQTDYKTSNYWQKISGSGAVVDWEASTNFDKYQLVEYNNIIYRCNADHTSGTDFEADKDYWEIVYANIPRYTKGVFYKANTIVLYGQNFYEAQNDNTAITDDIEFSTIKEDSTDFLTVAQTDTLPVEYTIDLGSSQRVTEIDFDNTGDSSISSIEVDISTDNSTFTKVYGYDTQMNITNSYRIALDNDCQYIKIIVNRLHATSGSAVLSNLVVSGANSDWQLLCTASTKIYDWASNTQYSKYDVVVESHALYRALNNFTSSSDFDTDFSNGNWESLNRMIVDMWASGVEYETGQVVMYGNRFYRCTYNHTSSSDFDTDALTYWIGIEAELTIQQWRKNTHYNEHDIVIVSNNLDTALWASGTSYAVDDVVEYNGYLYTCAVANSDTDFTEANWTQGDAVYSNLYVCRTENKDSTFDSDKWILLCNSDIFNMSITLANKNDVDTVVDKLFV